MKRLAVAANLPDAAYTRYHEAVASAMCDGDSKTVNDLVDSGYLSYGEAKAMQDVIASDRRVQLSTERTAEGRRFEEAWKGLRELGLCSACAADEAGFYAKEPASRCGSRPAIRQRGLEFTGHRVISSATPMRAFESSR